MVVIIPSYIRYRSFKVYFKIINILEITLLVKDIPNKWFSTFTSTQKKFSIRTNTTFNQSLACKSTKKSSMNFLLFLFSALCLLFTCFNLSDAIVPWMNKDKSLRFYIFNVNAIDCISFYLFHFDFLNLICIDLISSNLDFPFINCT